MQIDAVAMLDRYGFGKRGIPTYFYSCVLAIWPTGWVPKSYILLSIKIVPRNNNSMQRKLQGSHLQRRNIFLQTRLATEWEFFVFQKPFLRFFLKNERNLLLIFNWIAWIVLPATSWLAFFFVFFFFIVRKYHSIELNQHSAELCCRDRHLDGATQWARMLFEGKHCCLKIWANTDLFLFYFQPFLIPASITVSIWILKAETVLMVCLGFERAFRMVGAVETTELLRPPKGPLLSHELLKPSTELLVVSCCVYEMPKEV